MVEGTPVLRAHMREVMDCMAKLEGVKDAMDHDGDMEQAAIDAGGAILKLAGNVGQESAGGRQIVELSSRLHNVHSTADRKSVEGVAFELSMLAGIPVH
jgi:hypothetical protein